MIWFVIPPVIIGKAQASSNRVPVGHDPRGDVELARRCQVEKLLAHRQRTQRFGNAGDGLQGDQFSGF